MELLGNHEIPIGFSMALAKDTNAMNAFSSMSKEQRTQVVEQSRNIQSKEDMEQFVNSFTQNRTY
ncbi:hypothetical protein [Lachnoclostridium sp.]|uniref:hypothetical protein n=1 Tax=Lachnoclostridium sp. TaxID=2028282 RepID=UPI00289DC55F|nr:hypothetical protein [Lachnoclostridium sp.]